MAKKSLSGIGKVAGIFLAASAIFFSNPVYAKEEPNRHKSESIDQLINKDCGKVEEIGRSKSKGTISIRNYYFLPEAKGIYNGLYQELGYGIPLISESGSEKLSLEFAIGHMSLGARDVNQIRKEHLGVIPLNAGIKYNIFKGLFARGGMSCLIYHLDSVNVPPEPGGYLGVGIESSREKNPNFFLEVRRQFGNLNIDYPLLEDESHIMGLFVGGGVEFKF